MTQNLDFNSGSGQVGQLCTYMNFVHAGSYVAE